MMSIQAEQEAKESKIADIEMRMMAISMEKEVLSKEHHKIYKEYLELRGMTVELQELQDEEDAEAEAETRRSIKRE